MNEKIGVYFNNLINVTNDLSLKTSIFLNQVKIKRAIKEVIESGRDYLLTQGYLFHAITNSDRNCTKIVNNILTLSHYDYSFLDNLRKYVKDASRNLTILYRLYWNYLSREEQLIFQSLCIRIGWIQSVEKHWEIENLFEYIFQIIASYVLINKKSEKEFYEYSRPYLLNPLIKLDELLIQGVCKDFPNDYNQTSEYLWIDEERLFNYVMNNLDNNQKVIG